MAVVALLFGFILMWIVSWLTATPVRVVRAALKHVEQGDLDSNVVVFDGTELGELQRGFNSMVDGLRERERVRDLFGRHVGREVAAAAEQQRPKLGGEERHVAVIFVDIIGSTQLVTGRPATEVVDLLNRFFAVIVDEVDRHHGLVNKFEGDAALAVFGAPNHLDHPEDEALAAGARDRPSGSATRCRSAKRASAWRRERRWPATSAPRSVSSTPSSASRSTRPPGCASWPSPRPPTCWRHRRRSRTPAKTSAAIGLSATP